MKLCRFKAENSERVGILSPGKIKEIEGNLFNPGKETGTVPCIGKLSDGDIVEIEIEKIGILRNFVKAEKHWLDYTEDILRHLGSKNR